MKISTKGRYAVRIMIDLAQHMVIVDCVNRKGRLVYHSEPLRV